MRRNSASLLGLIAAMTLSALVPLAACGGGETGGDPAGSTGTGGGGGQGGSNTFKNVTIEPADAVLLIDLGGKATQSYKAFADVAGQKTDITASCTFYSDPVFGAMDVANFVALPHGGKTTISADCSGASGEASLTVKLVGKIAQGGATPDAAATFEAAALADDPARTPSIAYPLDRAVAPLNLPPIEVQYAAGANDLFHVSLASEFVTVELYTTDVSAALTEGDWSKVASSAAGGALAISVEGLSQAAPAQKFKSAPVSFNLSHDTIDKTAIYYWASSKGSILTQNFGTTTAPSSVKADCTSCHSVSRSGSRIGYSRCVGGDCGQIFVGFMRFDKAQNTWTDTVDANAKAIPGSYTTFAPVGYPYKTDKQSLTLITTNAGRLELRDPDTGALVPSNVGDLAATGLGSARAALMPDWSPDGKRVAFTSTPHPGQWIDLSDGAIAVMDYAFDGATHAFAAPKLLVNGPLAFSSGSYTNFFFPSFSPDGQYIVFNAARTGWRANPATAAGQRLALTDAAGSFAVELAEMNGSGDLDITWPHWAPGATNDFLWIVFSSERDYGHKITKANTSPACVANGVQQCKQLWLGALDKKKLANMGMMALDPSSPPVWLPGQDIDANNISPYWTVPTSEIPQ